MLDRVISCHHLCCCREDTAIQEKQTKNYTCPGANWFLTLTLRHLKQSMTIWEIF